MPGRRCLRRPSGHQTTGTTYTARLLLALSFVHSLEGDLPGVQRHATRLLQMGETHNLLESTAFAHYHLGMVAYYQADTETACYHLTAAIRNGQLADPNTYLHANCALALIHYTDNQPEKADEIAQALGEYALPADNAVLLGIANALKAELARTGHLNERQLVAKPSIRATEAGGAFLRAPIHPDQNSYRPGSSSAHRNAHDLLKRLHDFFTSVHNTHCLIEVTGAESPASRCRRRSTASALADLERALDLARQSRRIRPFLDAGHE